ncbi:hypothetical protein GGX14DRAFT_103947 [Mycena pura]|uniref:Arrestin-like N-terminal domain-containing protein n=1 Tax=Mycena pura TaxID=153505 RepID=A0AAD6YSP1_9AGAR|nr:hypothetical protein GGX14DRAFT_103947 [Mycena pura]
MSFPSVYGGTFSTAPSVTSLPAYTAHVPRPRTAGAVREPTEHLFELKDKRQKAWATLKLRSSARSAASLPTFLEGESITGSVTLDLSQSEKISGVTILIRGCVVTGPNARDRLVFLDISTPLWLKGMPNPRDDPTAPASQYHGKLSGDYHWPFSISLPKEVSLPSFKDKDDTVQTCHLPQTFLERTSQASVLYEFFVHIARSTFREDGQLQTMFVYVPAIRPDPPSRLRQLAYRQNAPIPGPDMDPEGWYTLRPATVMGTVFGARPVKIECHLSLAKPLSYTRGSVIPCSLTYLCDDPQALSLVCTPLTTNVCLHRQTTFATAPAAAEFNARYVVADPILEIARAVWWPVVVDDSGRRCRLDGEIHLPKSLKPSSTVSHFNVSYHVVMLPFQVTGFVAETANVKATPALKQQVQIATIFPKGPRPRFYTPPSYDVETGDNMLTSPVRGYI